MSTLFCRLGFGIDAATSLGNSERQVELQDGNECSRVISASAWRLLVRVVSTAAALVFGAAQRLPNPV
jgi:hypothetical protein